MRPILNAGVIMVKYKFKLTVDDTRPQAARVQGLVERQTSNLKREIKEYLSAQGGRREGDKIRVKVTMYDSQKFRFGDARLYRECVDLHISGVYAGKPFEFNKPYRGALQFGSVKPPANSDERPSAEEDMQYEGMFETLTEAAIDGFERAIGRGTTSIGVRWRIIKFSIIALAVCVTLGIYVLLYTDTLLSSTFTNRRFVHWTGWVFGVLTFFVGYTIGAACMPLEFFEEHAEGHRVMGFVNTSDPDAARRRLRWGVVAFVVIALFMTWTIRSTFNY